MKPWPQHRSRTHGRRMRLREGGASVELERLRPHCWRGEGESRPAGAGHELRSLEELLGVDRASSGDSAGYPVAAEEGGGPVSAVSRQSVKAPAPRARPGSSRVEPVRACEGSCSS